MQSNLIEEDCMRMRSLIFFILMAPATFAARADCGAAVTSQEAALRKADWIMEGTVVIIAEFIGHGPVPEVILDDTKIIQEREQSHIGKTIGIRMGPCFPGGAAALRGKAADRMTGQRMRFYGNRHVTDPTRRFFYAEPAQIPLAPASARAAAAPLTTKVHRIDAQNPLKDGWHRATSTDGKFGIDLPGPFTDATLVKAGHPSFVLRAKDRHGAAFIAVFEPSGPDSELAGSFDESMAKPGNTTTTFRGMPMLTSRAPLHGRPLGNMISNSLMLRVPGGTYFLGIAAPKEHEKEALRQMGRFLNSLQFE
jgi:hypothetical protein